MADFFDPALDGLLDALPQWWAHRTPGSELGIALAAVGELADELAAEFEGIYSDTALATARDGALRTEWAALYGAGSEQLPGVTVVLREYLNERAAEDGSIQSLESTLLGLLRRPENDAGGTPLVFPADGSGLTFPADGSGLTLFQTAGERSYLLFPADGSGLDFPADGSGITLPDTGRLEIVERFTQYRLDVFVRNWLVFDRAAFARAVARFRPSHFLPSTITETTH